MRWAGHAACMRERRFAYSVFVGKPEGTRPLRSRSRSRSRWSDNIKIFIQEIGWRVECINVTQNRGRWRGVLKAVMNFQFT